MRESNVVTKVFEVEYVAAPEMPPIDDDLEFQEDLEKQRTMVRHEKGVWFRIPDLHKVLPATIYIFNSTFSKKIIELL